MKITIPLLQSALEKEKGERRVVVVVVMVVVGVVGAEASRWEGREGGWWRGERNSARGTKLPPCMTRKGTVSD